MKSPRRIALVHDWLTGMRGGEKILELLCEIFPHADIFTLVYLPGQLSPTIESHRITTSLLQKIPRIGRYYRHLLPLMPWVMERFDFSDYDLVISTSHCVAKAAKPAKGAHHVCYCFTPMRYIWDQYDSYFGPGRASLVVRTVMKALRPLLQRWDLATVSRVSEFIAISKNIQERIHRIYKRDSGLIYPPVNDAFYATPSAPAPAEEPFYLIVSALAPYKRIDLAVETFRRRGDRLVIVGEGQESNTLKSLAGPKTEFLGWLSNEELRSLYQSCRALIFPGEEDFGIVPVEAMAAGCPVIALRKGGALETIVENETGVFFERLTVESLSDAVDRFEKGHFDRKTIRQHAHTFSRETCQSALRSFFIEYRDEMS
jgi:glycosyltransferase involved in cell wall biosynthesis